MPNAVVSLARYADTAETSVAHISSLCNASPTLPDRGRQDFPHDPPMIVRTVSPVLSTRSGRIDGLQVHCELRHHALSS